ncbi:MAG TPA: HNH endonuclease signature motif containing protein [Nocardioidaceae bacterium]|nr:HNH endonuclease signature motif containing protein [Nocardioidaceae bacterium]
MRWSPTHCGPTTGTPWYRLLTDPVGGFLELSTEGYEPTEAIWRWSVAENPQCIWPTCQRRATVIDIDHRVPYPEGRTSTRNLQPLCEHHHKAKHPQGFRVVREDDGSFTWTSRFGVGSRKPAPEYPGTERSRRSTLERHLADLVWAA